jgi:signal transduction histidine kinase
MRSDAIHERKQRFVSVGSKLTVAIIVVLALVTVAVYIGLSRFEREKMLSAREQGVRAVGELFLRSVSTPVVFDDATAIRESVALLGLDPEVLGIQLWRATPARETRELLAAQLRDRVEGGVAPRWVDHFGIERHADRIVFRNAVRDQDKKVIAVAAVQYSLARENAAYAELRRQILVTAAGVAAVLALILWGVTRRWIVAPLDRLLGVVRQVESGARVDLGTAGAHDEVGRLADAFGRMAAAVSQRTAALSVTNDKLKQSLEQQGAMQHQLLEASRRTGMADVATAVLHNVGNVLNSVNVSVGVLDAAVQRSHSEGLGKAAQLLREHEGDLPRFFAEDKRARLLPEYLSKLGKTMAEQRESFRAELQSLQKNVDHIRVIVSMQQSHAKVGGSIEPVSLAALLDDALSLNFASDEKHGLHVEHDYAQLPEVELDRHKLVQIVLNLLSNARDAVKDSSAQAKRITVRLRDAGGGQVAIDVEDTGCGFSADNSVKIFNHGFTTKKDGHGFGLHSSACAATEMGGALTAQSDGVGRGARFTLLLPLRVVHRAA